MLSTELTECSTGAIYLRSIIATERFAKLDVVIEFRSAAAITKGMPAVAQILFWGA